MFSVLKNYKNSLFLQKKMQFIFEDLHTYLSSGKNVTQYDYLYQHSMPGYPERSDFDAKDYYFVTEIDSSNGDIYAIKMGGKPNSPRVIFKPGTFSGHWWILSLPYFIKRDIFPSLP